MFIQDFLTFCKSGKKSLAGGRSSELDFSAIFLSISFLCTFRAVTFFLGFFYPPIYLLISPYT